MRLILEKKATSSTLVLFLVPLLSVVMALLVGAVFFVINGYDPLEVYRRLFMGAFGSVYGLTETVVKAIPLILCGLGVSIAFQMKLWNIGAEGQFYMGAFGASILPIFLPGLPGFILIPSMVLLGFLCGGLWGLLPAIPRAFLKVNETITTLLLNYVAILWVDFLVYGPWRDPASFSFPVSPTFPQTAMLPSIAGTRVHLGLVFALLAAASVFFLVKRTKWGYAIKVIGESSFAAEYAGMNIKKNICWAMLISGGLAGLAGMAEVAGIAGRLQHGLSPGYGYTAIIIAWLARLHPVSIVVVSFLFGGLLVGGYSIQLLGLPATTVNILQGSILFFVLGGQIFNNYRIKIKGKNTRDVNNDE